MLNKKMPLNETKTTQRFSIRKLTIGATSVLLGFFFFSVNGNQVQAAENTTTGDVQTALVQVQKENATPEETKTQETAQNASSTSNEATSELKVADTKAAEVKADDSKVEATETLAKTDAAQTQTTKDVTTTPSSDSAKDDALIPAADNTEQAGKVNGQGNNSKITNVPDDGSITYDYSISAKNKKTDQTEEVHSGASGKDNNATLNTNNASDIEAHFTLENTSDQDKVIGNTEWNSITPENYNKTKHPNEQATLFINAWSGSDKQTLKIDGSKAATLVVTKDGQVIANDPDSNKGLEIDYKAADGNWYKYDEFVQKFSQDAISNVTQIGFRGVLLSGTTATMNVPLIYDASGIYTKNQITTNALNAKSITVTTSNLVPVWSKTDDATRTAPIDITYRNSDGSYVKVPDSAEIWQEIADELAKEGKDTSSLLNIISSGNAIDTTGENLYRGGVYQIKLPDIQKVLQKFGYTVNPDNQSYQKLMQVYTYNTNGGLVVHENSENGGGLVTFPTSHPYFYIEVHKIVETKPASFEEKSNEAKNFNVNDVVSNLFDVGNRRNSSVGHDYDNVAVDPSDATIVSIKDAKGNAISKIDGNTPAGVYTVTVGYKLNGSNDPSMFITKTAQVTITPVSSPVQPTDPVKPSQPTDPTTPVQPTTPVTPVTPVQPTAPVNPSQPTAPVQPSDIRPLPQDNPGSDVQDNKTTKKNTQKSNKTNTQKGNKTIAPKATNVNHNNKANAGKLVAPKADALNNVTKKVAPKAAVLNTGSKANTQNATYVKKDAKTLPQTGDKNENNLSVLGLAAIAVAGLFGMGAFRKKKN
ncbi:MAG: YSIRK-type signal peptide-containing protein [Lactobacillus sp.]